MAKFKIGDVVIVYKDYKNHFTYELGKSYTILGIHSFPDTWYCLGDFNAPEYILTKASKLHKAMK